jgi:beta-N-acetylhexosaminidase
MAGFTVMMERRKAVPYAIAAGNDMFLFNKDIDEDYQYMLKGIKEGIITAERLDEAVTRILALKASLGLHRKKEEGSLIPDKSSMEVIGCAEHISLARDCADRSVTLVKDTQSLLPISPAKHKRILLFPLGDEPGYFAPGGAKGKHGEFKKLLENEGFEVEVFDKEKEGIEYLFESVDSFVPKYDLALYFANIATASNQTVTRITWAMPRGIDIPWFIEEKKLPSMFISFANPYHLYDLPRIKTFINAYNPSDAVLEAVIDKIMGRSEFKGINPVDPFCGLWDAKL